MESIGAYLRRERELRKIPIEDIARTTKISLRALKALEQNEIHALPGPVFVKGYIQSYAKTIGLNAEEAVLQFEEEAKPEVEKTGWLKPRRWQIRPWLVFCFFVALLFAAAFFSSR